MRAVALAGLLAACAYRPGSFTGPEGPFPGQYATTGCLDVAVGAADDPAATGQVVELHVANRCDHAVTIDLRAVRARGRDTAGRERVLAAYDPQHEIRPLPLEARQVAREVIELQVVGAARTPLVSACLDVAALGGAAGPREVCLTSERVP